MTTTRGPRLTMLGALLAAATALGGCTAFDGLIPTSPTTAAASRPTTTAPTAVPSPTEALALLDTLPIKGRAPRTGYSSDYAFWDMWGDPDGNGCDARNDVLARDLVDVVRRHDVLTGDCLVASGTLHDPYTDKTVAFVRGAGEDHDGGVQVDHVVARSDAWQKGAAGWTLGQRETFANDPLNLLAVDAAQNQAKGDGDAATWLPPDRGFRCRYVSTQVAVKARYGLWTTQAEHDAIKNVLDHC